MNDKAEGPCIAKVEAAGLPEDVFPGRLPKSDLRIAVAPGAHQAMWKHAKSSLDKEVCGVMLGRLKKDASGPFLMIDDVIEGEETQSSEAKVTFTPDSWDRIFKEQEKRDPELKMCGWYHTHPRFGIFLSSYDIFIHQNFFAVEPWMVAFVIDPVKEEEGFFYWHRGAIKRAERHWIGEQPRLGDGAEFDGRVIANDQAPAASPRVNPASAPRAGAPAPMLEEAPLFDLQGSGGLNQMLLMAILLLLVFQVIGKVVFGDPGERYARQQAQLQQTTVLVLGDLAAEVDKIRAHLGLGRTEQLSLLELKKLRADLEARLRERLEAERRRDQARETPPKKDGEGR